MAILIMNETKEDCGRNDSNIFLCPYTRHFERCSDGCKVISISDAIMEKIFLEKMDNINNYEFCSYREKDEDE